MNKELIMKNVKNSYTEEIITKVPKAQDIIDNIKSGRHITVVVIHHYDLDGYGVRMVWMFLEKLYPNLKVIYVVEPVRVTYDTYKNYLVNKDNYDYVVVGDLSLSIDVSENEYLINFWRNNAVLLDHHESALKFNDYEFAYVKPHDCKKGIITSGTLLMFHGFGELIEIHMGYPHYTYSIFKRFVEYIAAYDTYLWKENRQICKDIYGDIPDKMNISFKNCGDDKIKYMHDLLATICTINKYNAKIIMSMNNPENIFTSNQLVIIRLLEFQRDDEINRARKNMKIIDIYPYKVAVYYYSGKYGSEIGNTICEENPNIDYMLMIDMNKKTGSLRTVKDINLVKELLTGIPGAGGHPKACGFSFEFKDDEIFNIIRRMFLKLKESESVEIAQVQQPDVITAEYIKASIKTYLDFLRSNGNKIIKITDVSIDSTQRLSAPDLIFYVKYIDKDDNMHGNNFNTGVRLESIVNEKIDVNKVLDDINRDNIINNIKEDIWSHITNLEQSGNKIVNISEASLLNISVKKNFMNMNDTIPVVTLILNFIFKNANGIPGDTNIDTGIYLEILAKSKIDISKVLQEINLELFHRYDKEDK